MVIKTILQFYSLSSMLTSKMCWFQISSQILCGYKPKSFKQRTFQLSKNKGRLPVRKIAKNNYGHKMRLFEAESE